MKIRFISDLHSALNMTYEATDFVDIMKSKKPADVTLIAGDMDADIEEAKNFLNTYFKDEKVIFIAGNHCLTKETEVLTENGWKNISGITLQDRVYQYNNGYAELVNPTRIISNQVSMVYEFSSEYFYQCVTNKHRMILSDGSICLAEDLLDRNLFQKDFVLNCNTKEDIDYPIEDNLLKLLVWIITDGTIVLADKTLQKYTTSELENYKQKPTKTRIQFHLSKQRKIKDLENLLNALKYDYTIKTCKKEPLHTLQPYYIRFYSNNARNVVKLLEYKKTFPSWFLKLSKRQIQIVLDTLTIIDGMYYSHPRTKESLSYHIVWGHTDKNALNILQSCCIRHGFVFRYKENTPKDLLFGKTKCKSKKTSYLCDIYTKNFDTNTKNSKISIIKKEGLFDVYCLTVPSGAFLIRSHGKTSITGNCVYNNRNIPLPDLLDQYKKEFNGQWKFLENDYIWLNDDIAVIGTIGWTDYKYHSYKEYHSMVDEYGRPVDQEGKLLPIDPTETPEFKAELKKIWNEEKFDADIANQKMTDLYRSVTPGPAERIDTTFKNRVSEEVYNNYINWFEGRSRQGKKEFSTKDYVNYNKNIAKRCMNDFHYGRMSEIDPITKEYRYMTPDDCEKFHKESKKYIKFAYNKIIEKNPNATIILMTHHPFTKKCEHEIYEGKELNAAFMSDHDNWLKQFKNIKYYHCGHVHNRFFKKLGKMQIICNPMGYLWYKEHTYDKPFDINYIIEI